MGQVLECTLRNCLNGIVESEYLRYFCLHSNVNYTLTLNALPSEGK
jgi:hypothetical protein